MKVTQVSAEFVKEHYQDPRLYRLTACDDGNYGKSHTTARLKAVRRMTVEEVTEASDDNLKTAFVIIEV